MKRLINKLLGKAEQGQQAPASTAVVFTTSTSTKAPGRLSDIKQIIDDAAIQANIKAFESAGNIMADSVSKNGEYEFDVDGKPPVLKELKVLAGKTVTLCQSLVSFAKAPYSHYRRELEALLHIETEEERKDAFLKQNSEAITNEVSEAEKPLIEIKAKEEQMRNARDKKEEAADKRKKISREQYGGHPVDARAIRLRFYVLVLVAILPSETMLNIGALDTIESDLQSRFVLPTAITITGIIALSAHFLGVFIANKSHKGLIAVALGAAVMMLGIVFFLRANGIESAFVLTFINLAAFLLTSGLSYVYHKDDAYFKADEAHTKWRDREGKLEREIATIKKTVKDKVSGIYDKWNAKAAMVVEKEVKPLKLEILHLIREEEAFDSYLKTHVLTPIEALRLDFSTRAEINFYKARQKNGLPVTGEWAKDEAREDQDKEIETVEAQEEPVVEMNDHYNGYGFGRINDLHKGFYSLFLGLCFLGMTACDVEGPVEHIEVLVIGDASIAQADSASLPGVEEQLAYILGLVEFTPYDDPLQVTRDYIRVQLTHIGETSFSPVQTVVLEEGPSLGSMVKTKRRAEQKAFIEDVKAAIEVHTQVKGLSSSRVFDCLCQVLPPLVKSDAVHKEVFITSDLLENSEIDNFYKLHTQIPGQYPAIVGRLETHCPALKEVSFSGVSFTAVYLPDKTHDKSTLYSRRFWETYIEHKGGTIEFLPNLPDIASKLDAAHH